MVESSDKDRRIKVRDFFVGFFGSMLPGVLTIVLAIPAILVPGIVLIDSFTNLGWPDVVDSLVRDAGVQIFLGIVLVSFAYVIGFFLFRQEIKVVDRISWIYTGQDDGPVRIDWENEDGGKCHASEEIKKLRKLLKKIRNNKMNDLLFVVPSFVRFRFRKALSLISNLEIVEFPYRNLQQYLSQRMFTRAADQVLWDGRKTDGFVLGRSKHFISTMKMAINTFCPPQGGQLAQNEAHVRLASSVWYGCRVISVACVVGVALGFGHSNVARHRKPKQLLMQ